MNTITPIPAAQLREWREACHNAQFGPCTIINGKDYQYRAIEFADKMSSALPRLLSAYESAQAEVAALRELEHGVRALTANAFQDFYVHDAGPVARALHALDALRERTAELDARDAQGGNGMMPSDAEMEVYRLREALKDAIHAMRNAAGVRGTDRLELETVIANAERAVNPPFKFMKAAPHAHP